MADEYLTIDGHKLDDVQDISKQHGTPLDTDVLLVGTLSDDQKRLAETKFYKVKELLNALGKIATDAESGAVSAKEAAEAAKAICEEALASIGNSDTTGLRGQAVTAINSAKSAALIAIGENDTSGARGNALSKIAEALQNALATIGQNDNEGVRKAALEAIANALNSALSQIGQTDNDGARGDAITAIVEKFNTLSASIAEASSAFDTKVTQANATIDAKVKAASDSAAAAEQSAQEAAAAANSPLASETTAGRTRTTSNPDYSRPDGMTDPVAASIEALQSLRTKIEADMLLPMPLVSYTSDGSSATIKIMNTFTGLGAVTVRYKEGAEPSETDSAVDLTNGVSVTAGGLYYFRAFPGTGNTRKASPSSILDVEITPAYDVVGYPS